MLFILCESSIGVTHTGWFEQILIALLNPIIINMSEQEKETGVEQKERGTGGEDINPVQEEDPEEEYEDSDAISVEVEDEEVESVKPVVQDVFDLKTFEPVLKEGEEYFDGLHRTG